MLGFNPDKVQFWLGVFFNSRDMPVTEEELDRFWDSLSEDEKYAYYWAMESSWPWWREQGVFSVRKKLGLYK